MRELFKYTTIGLAVLFCCQSSIMAQRSVRAADSHFKALRFDAAAQQYQRALKQRKPVEDAVHVHTRIGDCYRLLNEPAKAAAWYEQAVNMPNADAATFYHYGQVLRSNAQYTEAMSAFERYASLVPEDQSVKDLMISLLSVRDMAVPRKGYEVTLVSFNTDGSDFGPFIWQDRLMFASNGISPNAGAVDDWTGKPYLRLAEVNGQGKDIQGMASAGPRRSHDGPACVDPLTGDLYLTKSHPSRGKAAKGDRGIVKLMIVRRPSDGHGGWAEAPVDDFPFNDRKHSVSHPSISPDGSVMYFASDMAHPQAMGGVDLYRVTMEQGMWGQLEHLGSEINTAGDEMFPHVDSRGDLYFASNGREGLGGLDIHKALSGPEGWRKIYNMGAPLNTHYDDFSMVMLDGGEGYFASNRPAFPGDDNIYHFKDEGLSLSGMLLDPMTGTPLTGAAIEVCSEFDETRRVMAGENGRFHCELERGTDYTFRLCADGYACSDIKRLKAEELATGKLPPLSLSLAREIPEELAVRVVSGDNGLEIPEAALEVTHPQTGAMLETNCVGAGTYAFSPAPWSGYRLSVMSAGYETKHIILEYNDIKGLNELLVELKPEEVLDVSTLENGLVLHSVYHDYNSCEVRNGQDASLDRVLRFMAENPDAVMRIESHTDARASGPYNQHLSDRRAASVKRLFLEQGVKPYRLETCGYGEMLPVNDCTDGVACTEEDHQQNRRTEFRIVRGNVRMAGLQEHGVDQEDLGVPMMIGEHHD